MDTAVIVAPGPRFARRTEVDEREPVMLFVISQECKPLVTMLHAGVENLDVPINQLIEAMGLINDMGEFAWRDRRD
jgi:hypothetical protein